MPIHQSHLGVYALITRTNNQELLVVKKSLGCYTGLYDLPGGGLDEGELLEDALKREVLEETGCKVVSHTQIGTLSFTYPYMKESQQINLRHIGVIYNTTVTGEPLSTPAGGDSDGCVWVNIDELSSSNASPLVINALKLNKTIKDC